MSGYQKSLLAAFRPAESAQAFTERGFIMPNQDRTERDKQWAARIQDGDRAAFRALFQAYAEPLCAFTEQYTESPEIAEELVQDLFLKIWKDRAQWSPSVSVKSYLYTAVRNLALDYLEHERVVETWQEEERRSGRTAQQAPLENLERKQLRRAVHEAVDQLPERRRHVFKLSRRHDLTYKEIATVLDLSIKTVETHMRRAFRFLREQLDPHEASASSSEHKR